MLFPSKPKSTKIAPSYSLEANKKYKSISIVHMPTKTRSTTNKFIFVTEKYYRENHKQITRHQFERLRARLSKGLFWVQPSGKGGAILWNLPLLDSFLTVGDSIECQALVEEFLSELPTAA
jgi:hypothetical protein